MTTRSGPRAALLAVLLLLVAAPTALAAPVSLGGSPLNVYVDSLGELQAFRVGETNGIFYQSTNQTGDAGFFLAFPTAVPPDVPAGAVYGFDGTAGPDPSDLYTSSSSGPVTGSGTSSDPLRQVMTYAVHPASADLLTVTQTTSYVNGSQEFRVRWVVHNATASTTIPFKALAAADFFFEGSDRGTGIFTAGPPRFIGGTNADTGSSGGFVEVLGGPSPPWSHYQALAFPDVWTQRVETAGSSTAPTFDDSVVGDQVDNAGGVEWDDHVSSGLAAGADATYEVIVRNAVPSALQLNPTNAGAAQHVPINVTATATDTNGGPYAGKALRYQITGVNPLSGALTLNAAGSGVITDPGTNAGPDTIVAFVDFNGDGLREAAEPQASALATFVDNIRPTCTVKVSGDRPGGGGAGKPLVITVDCGEGARVTTSGTLQVLGGRSASAARKPKRKRARKIKLHAVTRTVTAGKPLAFKLKIPKSVARRYAGRKLKATVKVTARDSAGNRRSVSRSRTIKLRSYKKSKKHRRR
jgi:hypothetical protein